MEEKLLSFKSNEIKSKAASENKLSEISSQNESYLDRLKATIVELEKKLSS